MAGHLVSAGHPVFINTRSKVPADLARSKATQCSTPREVAEQADMIFEPFFTTKSKDKALGLGLYSVRVIVERHGGQIAVIKPPGGGAALQVTLPLKP